MIESESIMIIIFFITIIFLFIAHLVIAKIIVDQFRTIIVNLFALLITQCCDRFELNCSDLTKSLSVNDRECSDCIQR